MYRPRGERNINELIRRKFNLSLFPGCVCLLSLLSSSAGLLGVQHPCRSSPSCCLGKNMEIWVPHTLHALASPPSCLQASRCTFICEGQLSLSTSVVWLLIFKTVIVSLFYLWYTTFWKWCCLWKPIINTTFEGILEHWENKVALPTDLNKLRWCHSQQLKAHFESKATHFKLSNTLLKLTLVLGWTLALGGLLWESSQAREWCDRRIRNRLQGILSLQTAAMSAETEDIIVEWQKLDKLKKPSS